MRLSSKQVGPRALKAKLQEAETPLENSASLNTHAHLHTRAQTWTHADTDTTRHAGTDHR